MSYMALYRQYRPQTFDEIKGQDPISKTLKNAIALRRLSHAYLFCGPRGTGKTSTAKVLAKAVNCPHHQDGEPCNQCDNCQRITVGTAMDVLEIDAASNRGIDEIRDLREKVNLSPVEGPYKVYIIDEVHMLTTEAFNALLKTLEEPPAHVIFILATTDPRKIPATILSRCQRFDFRQIGMAVILTRLQEIAQATGVKVEEKALYLIARQAQGGLRDALGLLDQCLAGGAKTISLAEVAALLGAVEDELLLSFQAIILTRDVGGALLLLDDLLSQGRDLKQFVGDLILFYRNLLLLNLGGKAGEIVAVAPEIRGPLTEMAQKLSQAQYMAFLRILNETENQIKWSRQGRMLVELGIMNLIAALDNETGSAPAVTAPVIKEPLSAAAGTRPPAARVERAPAVTATAPAKSPASVAIKPSAARTASAALTLGAVQQKWGNFLEVLRKKAHPSHEAFLREAALHSLVDGTLICEFQTEHQFHKERLEVPQVRERVEQVLTEFYGASLGLKCCLRDELAPARQSEPENDLVTQAMELFGGELVDIIDE